MYRHHLLPENIRNRLCVLSHLGGLFISLHTLTARPRGGMAHRILKKKESRTVDQTTQRYPHNHSYLCQKIRGIVFISRADGRRSTIVHARCGLPIDEKTGVRTRWIYVGAPSSFISFDCLVAIATPTRSHTLYFLRHIPDAQFYPSGHPISYFPSFLYSIFVLCFTFFYCCYYLSLNSLLFCIYYIYCRYRVVYTVRPHQKSN